MRMSFGFLKLKLPYTYLRGKTIIYQRSVPTDLQDRYKGRTVKHDLKTADWAIAARKVEKLTQRYANEWEGLRSNPSASPKALRVHAYALLRESGLAPGSPANDPIAEDHFLESLKEKLEAFAGDDREAYDAALPSDYLTPVEAEALRRLHGKSLPTLSDALELHLDIHPKRGDPEFVAYQRRAFDGLLQATGDKSISTFTRDDARTYVAAQLADKKATGTVERRLGVMRAVFTTWRLERDNSMANPFEKLTVPNAGKDRKARIPFTSAELVTLDAVCRDKDDDLRWMLSMLMDSGARLAEVVGLALDDIKLDASVPHFVIREHPWRSLKNEGSARLVPLVGASLWAAQRVVAKRLPKQVHAFPRYTSANECKATHASGTLVSWLRRQVPGHVVHELRHTMADRLRDVGCPKDIRYAIDGHASQDVGDTYGSGFGLPIMQSWLLKVALAG